MNKKALIIFIKNPVKGFVKTRLAKSIGEEQALYVYEQLLERTKTVSENVDADKFLFYSDYVRSDDLFDNQLYVKAEQVQDDNLGLRILKAFEWVASKGYEKILIIGSDCYDIEQKNIDQAFSILDLADVVIGPATDGGYYLLGLKKIHPSIFKDKSWSTSTLLKETKQTLNQIAYTYTEMETLHDIDTIETLSLYQSKIKYTMPKADNGQLQKTVSEVYRDAALKPDVGLCCTTNPIWALPGLNMPSIMLEMNYGCGSTVNPMDLVNEPTVLYVGVGGGMELLQFSYFSRKKAGVIGVDIVDEMLDVCAKNFIEAEKTNDWFNRDFVRLEKGNALDLPIADESVDVAGQNCLFNIFKETDLKKALEEMYRVLKPHGRLVMSDPVCEQPMPETLKNDERLRALCLSGSIPLEQYIKMITDVGFGTVEIRAKRLYRVLSPNHYNTSENIYIDSVEVCAIKDPMPKDGPCIFSGKSAIYFGDEAFFDDQKGHILTQQQPLSVCDKTAKALKDLNRSDIYVSTSTYFYAGGGCC